MSHLSMLYFSNTFFLYYTIQNYGYNFPLNFIANSFKMSLTHKRSTIKFSFNSKFYLYT